MDVEHPPGQYMRLPLEWTDRAPPLVPPSVGGRAAHLSVPALLALASALDVALGHHQGSRVAPLVDGAPTLTHANVSTPDTRSAVVGHEVVYLRQSTLRQVHDQRESTARQSALHQRALELGWPAERIDLLDENMGQSGSSASWRIGFQRLAEEVSHGRVGAIFSLEVSCQACSSADWRKLSKARRGALYLSPPVGYKWEAETSRFRLDPDEEVQRAVRLVFDRFRLESSA